MFGEQMQFFDDVADGERARGERERDRERQRELGDDVEGMTSCPLES